MADLNFSDLGEGRSSLQEQGAEIPGTRRHQAASVQGTSFWEQVEFCQFEILPGPQKRVKWGVPDGTRNPATGELVHDDQLISAALVAVLDSQDWAFSAPTFVIHAVDPLLELDKGFNENFLLSKEMSQPFARAKGGDPRNAAASSRQREGDEGF